MNYYNEHDERAAAWLRELIECGEIPDGRVDVRSITEVSASDLKGFTQCHFFAGIGGWSLALRLAGWPESEPVWTGSCPCQPFSSAGKQMGIKDPRHLWPAFRRLINRGRPPVVFGEQVANSLGRNWLAGVRSNLEAMGYAVGSADLCAAGFGAPHIRQRLYWLGESQQPGLEGHSRHGDGGNEPGRINQEAGGSVAQAGAFGGMGNSTHTKRERLRQQCKLVPRQAAWSNWESLYCGDGKSRRIESGTFPLAHGVSGRVGLLRGYGNAIVPQVASEFIQAYLES